MKENISKLLNDILFDDVDAAESLDLTKDEDYKKFTDYVDECNKICEGDDLSNSLTRTLFSALFGTDFKDIIDEIKKAGDEIHNEAVKKKKTPELPSSKTSIDKQQQIHKLVAEYVDTIIKPNTDMDDKVINDAYAGLFEFACWVMNR